MNSIREGDVLTARFKDSVAGGFHFVTSAGIGILVPFQEVTWSGRRPPLHYFNRRDFKIRVLTGSDGFYMGSIKQATQICDPWDEVKDRLATGQLHRCHILWRRDNHTVTKVGPYEAIVENTKLNAIDFNAECGHELDLKILKIQKHNKTLWCVPEYDTNDAGVIVRRAKLELFDEQRSVQVMLTFTPDYFKWFKDLALENRTNVRGVIVERSYSFLAGNSASGDIKTLRVFLPPGVIRGHQNIDIPMYRDKFDELLEASSASGLSINTFAIGKLPELLPFCAFPKHWNGFLHGKIQRFLNMNKEMEDNKCK